MGQSLLKKGSGQVRQHHDCVAHSAADKHYRYFNGEFAARSVITTDKKMPMVDFCVTFSVQDLTKGSNSHTKMLYSYELQGKLLTMNAIPCSIVQVVQSQSTNFI